MLRTAAPFIIGLALARSFHFPWGGSCAAAFLSVIGWCVLNFRGWDYARRWRTGALHPLAWLSIGITVQTLHDPRHRPDDVSRWADRSEAWRITVQDLISDNGRTARLWGRVDAALLDTGAHHAEGLLLLTLLKDSTDHPLLPGQRLLIAAKALPLDRVPDPGGFDQAAWAATQGAYFGCFVPKERWRVLEGSSGWPQLFQGLRDRVGIWLRSSGLTERERALVKAVLLGLRDEMDPQQQQDFIRSGTVHVLAVSGSHVAIIHLAVAGGLAFLGKRRRGRLVRGSIALVVLWCYAGITGCSPSVLRATITFSLFSVAEMSGWRTSPLNSLASAALVLLFWDPGMLVQPGFQLSFLAVLGIVLFYRPLMDRWTAPNMVLHYFWSLAAVSLAAQAFTLPLSLHLFHAFPVWFLPANLLVVGLVSIAVYGGIALLLFHQVPVLGAFVTQFMEGLLLTLGRCSAFFAHLPGAYPAVRINVLQCWSLYLLLLFAAVWGSGVWRGAKWGVLAMLGVFVIAAARDTEERNVRTRFTIYDDRNTTTVSAQQGRAMLVFGDASDPWAARKVERHRVAEGIDTVQWHDGLPRNLRSAGLLVRFDPGTDEASAEVPDVVVFTADRRYPLDSLFSRWKPGTEVVLAPTLPARRRTFLRRWCGDHGVHIHDVKLQGAYVRTDARGVDTLAPGAR